MHTTIGADILMTYPCMDVRIVADMSQAIVSLSR